MRTFINIITIVFVVVTGYLLLTKNKDISSLATSAYQQASTKLQDIGSGLPDITASKPEPVTPIPSAVLPGPLTKIPSAKTTAPAVPASTSATVPTASTTPAVIPALVPASGKLALTVSGIIAETNKQRVAQSESALSESAQLDASAQVKANDIIARQYFEHTAPDGKTVSDLVAAQGYEYIKIGENLALGDFTSDADVVTAWMNSPGHRANILDTDFKQMGVGVAYGMYQGHMVYVAVQHFGRPLDTCPTVDANLKATVESGQQSLTNLSSYLTSLKASIDQGTANGQDMNAQIAIYNQGVDTYQTQYNLVNSERVQYNNEVAAFNACVAK